MSRAELVEGAGIGLGRRQLGPAAPGERVEAARGAAAASSVVALVTSTGER